MVKIILNMLLASIEHVKQLFSSKSKNLTVQLICINRTARCPNPLTTWGHTPGRRVTLNHVNRIIGQNSTYFLYIKK